MGFEDIKTDGLEVEKLREEIKRYNNIYFGEYDFSITSDGSKKGQLEKYNTAKKEFLAKEFDVVKKYFSSLKWDCTENRGIYKVRASENIYLEYQYDGNCFIQFKNNDVHGTYGIQIESDFKENPYYKENKNSRSFGDRYLPSGGEAVQPDMIKERLEEIKTVIEHNASLNGTYNFRIFVDKDGDNYNKYEGDIEWKQYNSVMDIFNEISKEYYS